MEEKLLYAGKAKEMWTTEDEDQLRVVYLDQATQLNGKQKEHFAGKGPRPTPFPTWSSTT